MGYMADGSRDAVVLPVIQDNGVGPIGSATRTIPCTLGAGSSAAKDDAPDGYPSGVNPRALVN